MRILYLHQYFNTPEMPGSTRSYEMGKRLVKLGHEVHIVTSWRGKKEDRNWFTTTESGMSVHWLPVSYDNTMSYTRRIFAFIRFAFGAARKSASIPADVVFATSTPLTIALPGAFAASRQKIPMVFEVRDLWPEVPIALGAIKNPVIKFLSRRLELFAYKNSSRIVALAPGMADSVNERGVPAEKITVIPNACDTDLFDEYADSGIRSEYEWLQHRPLILYAGTLGFVNGVSYLVDLAKHLDRILPEARIVIVGEGKEYELVKEYAEATGILGKNIFLIGSLAKKQTAAWVATADITTSMIRNQEVLWKNAVTNKFFDSLAAGKPIACNHPGWQTEIAIQEGVGVLLQPEDPEAGAETVKNLLKDKDSLHEAGKKARLLAENQFSRDRLAGELASILGAAVNDKGAHQ